MEQNISETNSKSKILVLYTDSSFHEEAEQLARHLQGVCSQDTDLAKRFANVIRINASGIALIRDGLEMQGDFSALQRRFRTANLRNEMLIKASGIYRKKKEFPFAIDATAGMGEDAFLLAAAGFRVQLFERDPVIAALLQDSMLRAKKDPQTLPIIERMELTETDSIKAMRTLKEKPDVILLDPMFPERQKSGLVKKKFQLLHHLEKPCTDERELMDAALSAHPGRIIVKRPLKGPYLAEKQPSYSVKGKSIRYDCYILPDSAVSVI